MSATLNLSPAPAGAASRTLRELVTTHPQLRSDAWCRRLIADLLRSIESQQAAGRPHRLIMADTVLIDADGNADLLAAPDQLGADDAPFQPAAAFDLKAIAAVLHYAISGEAPPAAPLLARALPGYSPALLAAIDACLHGERSQRPQTIDDLRGLLGMAVAAPAPEDMAQSAGVGSPAEMAALSSSSETLTAGLTKAAAPEQAPTPAAEAAPLSVADELEQAIAGLAAAVGIGAEPVGEAASLGAREAADEAASNGEPAQPIVQALPGRPALGQASTLGHPSVLQQPSAPLPEAQPAATVTAAKSAPPSAYADAPVRLPDAPSRSLGSRLLLAALGLAVLAGVGYGLYQKGRQAGAEAVLAGVHQESAVDEGAPLAPALAAPVAAVPAVPAPRAQAAAAAVTPATIPAQRAQANAPVDGAPPPADAGAGTTLAPAQASPRADLAASATYKLVIKPWGTVYVDGVKRGISPPLKSLSLTGEHSVRIDNPGFSSRLITVRPGQDNSTRIEHDFR